jgi:hypothetical protein
MTHEFSPNVPIEAGEGHRTVASGYGQVTESAESALLAEADGNRTRQRRVTTLAGLKTRGTTRNPDASADDCSDLSCERE